MASEISDKGYASRKLHMAYFIMGLGTGAFLATGKWPSLVTVFPEYCMFLLASASIYAGTNAAVKWISAKSSIAAAPAGDDAPAPAVDPIKK